MAAWRKTLLIGLSLLLTAGLLAACGGNEGNKGNKGSAEGEKNAGSGGLKPAKLRFYFPGDKPQATDEVWQYVADLTKEKLNATFEINYVNWNDYKDKMKLLQASGDNYDLNFDANWLDFPNAMNRGGYLDLTDLLPEYAPKLSEYYEKEGLLDPIKIKGRVYAAPWTVKKSIKPIVWYRGDLAAKGGYTKDKITTVEELDEYLHAVKKASPQILPISWRPDSWFSDVAQVFLQKYEYENLNFSGLVVKIDDPNHTVIPWEQTEAFKEYVTYVKKWNENGLIPKKSACHQRKRGGLQRRNAWLSHQPD